MYYHPILRPPFEWESGQLPSGFDRIFQTLFDEQIKCFENMNLKYVKKGLYGLEL